MTKRELLGRAANVIVRLREIRSNSPGLAFELTDIEAELDKLEAELGLQIDEYMARQYEAHYWNSQGRLPRHERVAQQVRDRGGYADDRDPDIRAVP